MGDDELNSGADETRVVPRTLSEEVRRRRIVSFLLLGLAVFGTVCAGLLFLLSGRERARAARLFDEAMQCRADRAQAAATRHESPLGNTPTAPSSEDVVDSTSTATVQEFKKGVSLLAALEAPLQKFETGRFKPATLRGAVREDAVTVVNLWATYCKPCKTELPLLKDLMEKQPPQARVGMATVDLSGSARPPDLAAASFLPLMPNGVQYLFDEFGEFSSALKTPGLFRGDLPVTFVLDCRRKARWVSFGELKPSDIERLGAKVAELAALSSSSYCSDCPDGRCEACRCGDGVCQASLCDEAGIRSPGSLCVADCDQPDDGVCCRACGERERESLACTCGDGTCSTDERRRNLCARDCGNCGDKKCEGRFGETTLSCPADCARKAPGAEKCGTTWCQPGDECKPGKKGLRCVPRELTP